MIGTPSISNHRLHLAPRRASSLPTVLSPDLSSRGPDLRAHGLAGRCDPSFLPAFCIPLSASVSSGRAVMPTMRERPALCATTPSTNGGSYERTMLSRFVRCESFEGQGPHPYLIDRRRPRSLLPCSGQSDGRLVSAFKNTAGSETIPPYTVAPTLGLTAGKVPAPHLRLGATLSSCGGSRAMLPNDGGDLAPCTLGIAIDRSVSRKSGPQEYPIRSTPAYSGDAE